jgi:hypothetical protein
VTVAGAGGPGAFSDAATTGTNEYFDYRIDPDPTLNWCVDAAPASPGNLITHLNRKLDGAAGVLRCSDNLDGDGEGLGVQRNFTLRIDNDAVCDLLAEPDAGLPLVDGSDAPWNGTTSIPPCVLPTNDNPRISLATLYKPRAKTTNIKFQTVMFDPIYPVSYVIDSDGEAPIIHSGSTERSVSYQGTYHLVRFNPKAKTVGPAFTMPVRMVFNVQ